MSMISRNGRAGQSKTGMPSRRVERIATNGPVTAIIEAITSTLQPSFMCTRRFFVEMSSACTKNSRNQAKIAELCSTIAASIAGSMGAPLKSLPPKM